ncbi:NADPH-dependent F420 reductase [Leifsonia virtsii]|uniref:NAD(P)-binding domain-containing protein n=1 Tax=Leifsonia virtsii TaxID=3035915 RepID=A0ABT8J0L4_9MICO|nr:NAD(P)-binding domain-containing protein [Leifsonia virtsii]MDN4598617.1 NAD(P)-binding domain-containing protein [Leifsonia virtsii]
MTTITERPRVAILGVGHVGSALARILIDAGYPVDVAASGDPQRIQLIASVVMPGARPRWAAEAVADADIVILAIPLHRFAGLHRGMLDGKLVVDSMNYWAPTDGVQPLFEDDESTSSEVVQRELAGASVVKTFNHIGYHEMEEDRRPAGDADRRALGIASDDPEAAARIAALVDDAGYDAVLVESLRDGVAFEPGGPVFGARLGAADFRAAVAGELLPVETAA